MPHEVGLAALRPLVPVLLSYLLSFIYLGIYWNNHHHMLHVTTRVTGAILWANLHLLFWLSLVPFVTGWMGENHFAAVSYGALRRGAPHGRDRLPDPAAANPARGGAALRTWPRRWAGTSRGRSRWCSTSWPSARRS